MKEITNGIKLFHNVLLAFVIRMLLIDINSFIQTTTTYLTAFNMSFVY